MKTRMLRRNPDVGQSIAYTVLGGAVLYGIYEWWKGTQLPPLTPGQWGAADQELGRTSFSVTVRETQAGDWRDADKSLGSVSFAISIRAAQVGDWRDADKELGEAEFIAVIKIAQVGDWQYADEELGEAVFSVNIRAVGGKFSMPSQMQFTTGPVQPDGSATFSFQCLITNNGIGQDTRILNWEDNVGLVKDWRRLTLNPGQTFTWEFAGSINFSTFFSQFGRQEWVITLTGDWEENNISVGRIDTTTLTPALPKFAVGNDIVEKNRGPLSTVYRIMAIDYQNMTYTMAQWWQGALQNELSGYSIVVVDANYELY